MQIIENGAIRQSDLSLHNNMQINDLLARKSQHALKRRALHERMFQSYQGQPWADRKEPGVKEH